MNLVLDSRGNRIPSSPEEVEVIGFVERCRASLAKSLYVERPMVLDSRGDALWAEPIVPAGLQAWLPGAGTTSSEGT